MESQCQTGGPLDGGSSHELRKGVRRTIVAVNCLLLVAGNVGCPLIIRLYFLHGGEKLWLSAWLQTAGWPLLLLPLLGSYLHRRRCQSSDGLRRSNKQPFFFMTPPLFLACAVLGALIGADDFLYSYGLSCLPVSTATLLISTQLVFTAVFAFFIVKQRFTPFTVNAVLLLSLGAVVLGLNSGTDRPKGVSRGQYLSGFFLTVVAAVLYGLILPMIELAYRKAKLRVTFTLVMEVQLVIGFFATAFCTIGMIANKDFQTIAAEGRSYALGGETTYYAVLAATAVMSQMFFVGVAGVISCGSSLLAAVIIAALIPAVDVLAVVLYKEKFGSEKAVSVVLCLWGFVSYNYGEARGSKGKSTGEAREMVSVSDAVGDE